MNEEIVGEARIPKGAPFEPARPDVAPHGATSSTQSRDVADRNEIFARLVEGDTDIAGLVAYSIYKQNKLDWLAAFETAKARAPDEAELASYIIGESTPRRLATYRQLADATLAGQGASEGLARPRLLKTKMDASAPTSGLIATYALVAALFVVGFWLAAHYTIGR